MALGSVIADRFELVGRAASGAMGSIYRARDLSTGAEVAVKVLNLKGESDRGRFQREANLLAMLVHPHLVGYIAHGATADGIHFLVQDWVDGIVLRTQIRTLGVTAAEGVVIARGLVEALGAAHAMGIVHRDVKPDNIILERGLPDRVKLVDFGIARTTDQANRLTRTGTVIGTPSYMSPEQARGLAAVDWESDIWSAGCVLFEMLTGRQVFTGQTPMAVRAKVLLETAPSLAPLCPEAPEAIVLLVQRMLSRVQEERPSTEEILAILRHVRVPDGPRRVVGVAEKATAVMPERAARAVRVDSTIREEPELNCFVFFGTPHTGDDAPDHGEIVNDIAQRHSLEAYVLQDGTAVLSTIEAGKVAVLAAAHAAIELRARIPDAAIAIVGQRADVPIDGTLERGARSLEKATMSALFGDAIDGAQHGIHIDPELADLVSDEVEIEILPDGPVLAETRGTNRM